MSFFNRLKDADPAIRGGLFGCNVSHRRSAVAFSWIYWMRYGVSPPIPLACHTYSGAPDATVSSLSFQGLAVSQNSLV